MANQKEKFYKLNEKATIFYDQQTDFKIVTGQVKALPENWASSTLIKEAIKGGFLMLATEEDRAESEDNSSSNKPEYTPPSDEDLEEMTKSELVKEAKKAGASEELVAELKATKDADQVLVKVKELIAKATK